MKIAFIVFCLIFLMGCGDSIQQCRVKVPSQLPSRFVNDNNQVVEVIPMLLLNNWLTTNKDKKIISITSYSSDSISPNSNPTTGFIIVHEKINNFNKPNNFTFF